MIANKVVSTLGYKSQISALDYRYMSRALRLAAQADRANIRNNFFVGAVLVGENGAIIGEAYHQRYGELHAERLAILNAQDYGHDTRNSTIYVTLEPCSHWGKTPPCVDTVIESGIKRVVSASRDPNPLVCSSQSLLEAVGIATEYGVLQAHSRAMNVHAFSQFEPIWETVGPLTHLGTSRDQIFASFDSKYGQGNWRQAWQTGSDIFASFDEVIVNHYEASYRDYFRKDSAAIQYLVDEAAEVYDNHPSNITSGYDYWRQENAENHFQDIAVRNILRQLACSFKGNKLIQVRNISPDPVGQKLSPWFLPFHSPSLILPGRPSDARYSAGSAEDFYRNNRVLQIASHANK